MMRILLNTLSATDKHAKPKFLSTILLKTHLKKINTNVAADNAQENSTVLSSLLPPVFFFYIIFVLP